MPIGGNPNWKKGGPSPNPTGRPSANGIGQYIRHVTSHMQAQVHEAIALSLHYPDGRVRLAAIQWLADRAYGRAVETTVSVDAGAEGKLALLEGLTLDQLGELASGRYTIGSTTVVALPQPPLQLPETAAVNTETQGSTREPPGDNAESQSLEPAGVPPGVPSEE